MLAEYPRVLMRLTRSDQDALRAYWRFYGPRSEAIIEAVRNARDGELSEWTALLSLFAAQPLGDSTEGWEPYLASLRAQGNELARDGVSYSTWIDLISRFRDAVREELTEVAQSELAEAAQASRGLDRLIDILLASIGEAYIAAKQRLVAQTEARYRSMFEHSPLPMWTFDRSTLRFVSVNEAAIRHYGYSREELMTMTLADIRRIEDLDALKTDVRQAIGLATPRLWTHRKKDGTFIKVEISANDFVDAGRDLRLVLVNDVTNREIAQDKLRKTEEQLYQAQKMDALGRLAGGVAHDFNNVLTVIESYASIVEETFEAGDPRTNDITEIRRAAERATDITRQLLTLSRHSIYAPRPIKLDEVIEKYRSMLHRILGERITVSTRPGNVPAINADNGRIEQVLLNLAVNARDAMPDGGRLALETDLVDLDVDEAAIRGATPGRHVVLAVSDTGAGMDAATQARIFDPFFTTKAPGKGTGLGLSIVHGIVSQAGGTISVYSELGRGTTFRVYLPVPVGSSQETAPEQPTPSAPRQLPPITVLVVDDHVEVRTVAVRILTDAGCRVLEAASAAEALHICVSHDATIDLAILDLVLGDGRGDLLLHQLRELRPSLEVVLMSGYPAGALSASGAAPPDLLEKPFSPRSLRAAVARRLGSITPAPATTTSSATATLGPRILIVDDDDEFRRSVARALRKSDFEVIEAGDGNAAVETLAHERCDVVLSDVQMPGITGLDLIRSVRRVDLDLPVILMTGAPDLPSATAALEYGAFRYITKPLDTASLAQLLRHTARAYALARIRREALSISGAAVGAVDRAGLEVRFEQALDKLWMASQDVVHASSGELFGAEVLVRSHEPSMSTPVALLDAATQLARLPRLGRKVRALSAEILRTRYGADQAALFVNLHPEDLFDRDLVDAAAPLTQYSHRVILEITERAALRSSPELRERIARLRELGFRIAVDDIGAGYSGLTSFTELVPEIVKIDMSLVRNVHRSAVQQRTIAALCRLCHDSGSLVVAEGVEAQDERECLTSLGCDLLQGYLLGRPRSARDGPAPWLIPL